jgi:serine/tyrosine/threonine adenylyltransferase
VRFDNRFVRELPGDSGSENTRRQVPGVCYSRVRPTPVTAARLVAHSREVADLLDLPTTVCESETFLRWVSGNQLLPGMEPYAMRYGGHQFGVWAGQLGDGRAINLGEIVNLRGERWALQLKGAGPTPFARMADGFAVLRSSVREFLCSEAMHHLGVPTTRALSLVTTGEHVIRDMFYDGRPRPEPGAIVCRVAPSFVRFGNFEIHAASGETDVLRALADYTIRVDFPQLGAPSRDAYVAWFEEVCRRTAVMVAHWMRVGFVHGVMNTDNMSILGLTIDYGPYGWLDGYDPEWTPNTTDAGGRRYRYAHQPQIALWNLVQLANAIYPLIEAVEPLEDALETYKSTYQDAWRSMMVQKLGVGAYTGEDDDKLVQELLALLAMVETDMTIFYRRLAMVAAAGDAATGHDVPAPLLDAFYEPDQLTGDYRERLCAWLRGYLTRAQASGQSPDERRERMNAVNPKYVFRNYLAQLAIDEAEQGDASMVSTLLEVLRHPYEEQPEHEKYAARRPDWARERPGCSMLSCSS